MTRDHFSPARLRQLREARGLTQVRLAELSGLAQPNYVAIESGRRVPTITTAARIARALGVELSALIG